MSEQKIMSREDKDKLVGFAMRCAGKTSSDELNDLISLCDRLMKAKVIEDGGK